MNPIFKKRMMNLAGIKNDDFVEKNQTEKAADDYFGMNDEVEWDNKIQGFNSLIKRYVSFSYCLAKPTSSLDVSLEYELILCL